MLSLSSIPWIGEVADDVAWPRPFHRKCQGSINENLNPHPAATEQFRLNPQDERAAPSWLELDGVLDTPACDQLRLDVFSLTHQQNIGEVALEFTLHLDGYSLATSHRELV